MGSVTDVDLTQLYDESKPLAEGAITREQVVLNDKAPIEPFSRASDLRPVATGCNHGAP
jgi:hypothetical protein